MLIATIDDLKTHLLFLEEKNSKLFGQTIYNNSLSKIDYDALKILNFFKLGKNTKLIENTQNYKVILDLDSGLYHYYKDGKENIDMLYMQNGENATLFSEQEPSYIKKLGRKFNFKGKNIVFANLRMFKTLLISLGILLALNTNLTNSDMEFLQTIDTSAIAYTAQSNGVQDKNDSSGSKQQNEVDNLGIEDNIEDLTLDEIKTIIYSNPTLLKIEKDFLFNEELINDILPYYKSGYSKTIIRENLKRLNIVPFTPEEILELNSGFGLLIQGFYNNDGILHVYNYTPTGLKQENNIKKITGHEDVHFWQTNHDFPFINEAGTEILSHEYFLGLSRVLRFSTVEDSKETDGTYNYSYSIGCQHLKVLMEIIGSDVIMDQMFNSSSTAVYDAVKPYFSEQECDYFMMLMSTKPNIMSDYDYYYLRYLLSALYYNKYGLNMLDDEIINAIFYSSDFNRVYFRKSLKVQDQQFYIPYEKLSIEEAEKRGVISFIEKHSCAYSSIDDVKLHHPKDYKKTLEKDLQVKSRNEDSYTVVDDTNVTFDITRIDERVSSIDFKGTVVIALSNQNDEQITIDVCEIEKYGLYLELNLKYEITSERYFNEDNLFPLEIKFNEPNWRLDKKLRVVVSTDEREPIYFNVIDSPLLKSESKALS